VTIFVIIVTIFVTYASIVLTTLLIYTIKSGRLSARFYKSCGMIVNEKEEDHGIDQALEEVRKVTGELADGEEEE